MVRIIGLGLLIISLALQGAQREEPSEQEARSKIKKTVLDYITKIQKSLGHVPGAIASIATPDVLIPQEVNPAPIVIRGTKGYMYAHNALFVVDMAKLEISKYQYLQKIEASDKTKPTVSSIACSPLYGTMGDQVLLGESSGRVLIINPETRDAKTFGHVDGDIRGFVCDEVGQRIAVQYTSVDSAGLPVPCFALSKAFLAEPRVLEVHKHKPKHRSWESIDWLWTEFATKKCEHAVNKITFDDEYCVTECATGNIEKWELEYLESKPELVRKVLIEAKK